MIGFNSRAAITMFLFAVIGCGTSIDPTLLPYVGNNKNTKLFLSKSIDEQIQIYLKVAALPGHPHDYSLGPLIAISNGDIGRKLEDRLREEKNYDKSSDLIRLAGEYCKLNENCKGEAFLNAAAESAGERLPDNFRDFVRQSLDWIKQGVAGNLTNP
jgi:hypothetical protein